MHAAEGEQLGQVEKARVRQSVCTAVVVVKNCSHTLTPSLQKAPEMEQQLQ